MSSRAGSGDTEAAARFSPALASMKGAPPPTRPGSLRREGLLERIRNSAAPVVAVSAPAGFGKTTLLAQYAEGARRPVAWLSLDPTDGDPALLLLELAVALGADVTADPRLLGAFGSAGTTPAAALPILAELISSRPGTLIVLDDVHLLDSEESRQIVAFLAEKIPDGCRIMLASRESPPIPLARLRASGKLLELRQSDLALEQSDTKRILVEGGAELSHDELAAVHERLEGWAVGVYLASVAAAERDGVTLTRPFGGDHRTIVEYLTSEILERQTEDRLGFLLRTSLLDRFTPSLCDAVLARRDSVQIIDQLVRDNLFVVSLDETREWYRYHHLFADALRAELARTSPRAARTVHRRAATWHVRNGTLAEAIDHAIAAGERQLAAELVAFNAQRLYNTGLQATIVRWLGAFSEDEAAEYPPLALVMAWAGGLLGDKARSRRFLALVESSTYDGPLPLGEGSLAAAIAVLRAAHGWDGIKDMRARGEMAYRLELPRGLPDARAGLFYGASLVLSGRYDAATGPLHEATAFRHTDPVGAQAAIAFIGLAALHAGDVHEAEARLLESLEIVECFALNGYLLAAPTHAGLAAIRAAGGDTQGAREQLDAAVAVLPRAASWPWLAIYIRTLCGRAAVALDDLPLAASLLKEARRELARYPDAGALPRMLAKAERDLEELRRRGDELAVPLTDAERRVFDLLPTHLSAEEIGARLHISRNTVKSHQRSIYRKLGVDSRSEAVARARLLDRK